MSEQQEPHSLAEHEWMAESVPDRIRHLEHDHGCPAFVLDPYRRGMDQGTSQALGRIHREYPHADSVPRGEPYGTRRGMITTGAVPFRQPEQITGLGSQLHQAHEIIAALLQRLPGASTLITDAELAALPVQAQVYWRWPEPGGLAVGIWPGDLVKPEPAAEDPS